MKILFNTFRFPTVKVKITNDTDTDNDSYNRNMGLCLDFIYRQREMKKSEIQYLDYSVVVVNNTLIQTILNGIWRICPPLNTVYLVTEMSVGIALLKCINNPIYSAEYINTYIEMNNITKI